MSQPEKKPYLENYGRNVEHLDMSDVEDKSDAMRDAGGDQIVTYGAPHGMVKRTGGGYDFQMYYGAFSDGQDVMLVRRDANGRKLLERISDFRHYFFVRTPDAGKISEDVLTDFRRRGVYKGMEPDEEAPDKWTKVFVSRPITLTEHLKERSGKDAYLSVYDERQRDKFASEKTYWRFLEAINACGVDHFEADLTPRQRWMTDNWMNIENRFRELYLDIETDDRIAGFERLEDRRILSIAWLWRGLNGEEERRCVVLDEDDNESERKLLLELRTAIQKSEILYAWNGFNFDFPIIRARMRRRGVDYNWCLVVWCDLLSVFRRYFFRAASVGTSFSLNDIGKNVLHQEKVDWRERIKVICQPGCAMSRRGSHERPKTYYDLWRHHPELLEVYNVADTEILALLEKEQGFAKMDQAFCRIGNCVPGDFHISTKIDMLLLKMGKKFGYHFRTNKSVRGTSTLRTRTEEDETEVKGSTFSGGFVFEPKKGLKENVAALDFKSLYPSMMVLFNISPDTYVDDADCELRGGVWHRKSDGAPLITCPTGARFLRDVEGFIPKVFKGTLEKRKKYQNWQINEEVGSDKFLLYYRLAYSFKRLGLSFYGEMGHRVSRYYQTRVAEAVTLSGQFFIKESAKLAEGCGLEVLYGDTDSMYIGGSDDEIKEFLKITDPYYKKLCRPFNVDLKRWIVELEYENYFKRIFFVKKKRYAGLMSMYKGKEAPGGGILEVKGLEYMRSDGTQYGRDMQKEVMDVILREPPELQIEMLQRLILKRRRAILSRRLTPADVQLTQSIEKDVAAYKTKPHHVRVATFVKETAPTEYFAGMKVPWVMIDSKKKPPEVVWSIVWTPDMSYDAEWVWDARTFPPSYRVLMSVYPDEDWGLFFVGKVPKLKLD